jgi:hypothetical protein
MPVRYQAMHSPQSQARDRWMGISADDHGTSKIVLAASGLTRSYGVAAAAAAAYSAAVPPGPRFRLGRGFSRAEALAAPP